MRATWQAFAAWPHPESKRRHGDRFRAGWDDALALIEAEVVALKGSDVLFGAVMDPNAVNFSGNLRAGGRTAFRYRGVEVSFDVPARGRLAFHTDAYDDVTANLRAIGLGLKALRAVDRHGITTGAQQYAGFAMLGAGNNLERGRALVADLGRPRALKATHPDTREPGYVDADFRAVTAYLESLGG